MISIWSTVIYLSGVLKFTTMTEKRGEGGGRGEGGAGGGGKGGGGTEAKEEGAEISQTAD